MIKAMSELRQARATQTRAKIIRSAAEVFDESGFHGASMSRIVNRAGATMGAVYFHFASKEELAKAVMAEQAVDLRLPQGEGGLQYLVDVNLALAAQIRTDMLFRAGVRLAVEQGNFGLSDATPYRLWIERFREQLAVAAERGELLPGADPEVIARVLVGSYSGTQLLSRIMRGHDDIVERIVEMWRCFLPGIATPEAIARIRFPSDRSSSAT